MLSYPYARQGLSGAPVARRGVTSGGVVIYVDAQNKFVLADGSLFTGSFVIDGNTLYTAVSNGSIVNYLGGAIGGASSTGSSATTASKKCCNCTDSPASEVWFLAPSRRTTQDIAVRVVRRKIQCADPNFQVTLDCDQIKARAGLNGLGSLNCNAGCDGRM